MKKEPSLFSKKVWELARSIPKGRVTTYGMLARAAGGGGQAARSITAILSKAPKEYTIPFHRIVYAGGKVWCSPKYDARRKRLYKKEGIEVDTTGRITNFRDVLYEFN